MDCLFTDSEKQEMLIYIEELRARNIAPIIYAAPDWNPIRTLVTSTIPTWEQASLVATDPTVYGYTEIYRGVPIYTCDSLDSRSCLVLPQINNKTYWEEK